MKYIDDYTKDPSEYLEIVWELDQLLSKIEFEALKVHLKAN